MNILAFLMPLAEKFLEAEKELYVDPKQISTFESAIVEASNQSAVICSLYERPGYISQTQTFSTKELAHEYLTVSIPYLCQFLFLKNSQDSSIVKSN